jgi:hypothetical protein
LQKNIAMNTIAIPINNALLGVVAKQKRTARYQISDSLGLQFHWDAAWTLFPKPSHSTQAQERLNLLPLAKYGHFFVSDATTLTRY